MQLTNAYQQYQESQVTTASRGKLLLMGYDGAIRFVRQAHACMAERNYEGQNTCILKAQRIVLELMSTLNMDASPELAQHLMQVYEYLFNRLLEANVNDNLGALEEVQRHLVDLRSAWADADRQVAMAGAGAASELHEAVAA